MKQFFRHQRLAVLFFGIPWGIYFLFLWSHMLFFDNGNLMAGHPYVWADWSMHIALAANFAFRPVSHWFDSLPVFSGAPVTYPFVTNLISGFIWKLGFSLPIAFLLPSIVWTALTLFAIYVVFVSLLKSQKQAILAGFIFLCSGGIGAFFVLAQKGISAFFDSTQIVTQMAEPHIEMNTLVASMFFPQRAFLLGFPVGVLVLWVILNTFVFHWKKTEPWHLIVAGFLAGLLPIIHTHTFLCIVLCSGWIFLRTFRMSKDWLLFAAPATALSLLMYLLFLQKGVAVSTFFSLNPGWIGKGSLIHWILFWLENWGGLLPLAAIGTGILYLHKRMKLLWVVGFFWALFLLSNFVQFQPQEWDNTKMFAWVYFGLSVPATIAIATVAHSKVRFVSLLCAGALIFLLTVSGGIDLLHNLDLEHKTFQMLSADEIAIGEYARLHTPPDSVFFTRPMVSNPISMIGGRSVYLGYPGWAFSYGLPYDQREGEIRSVFVNTLPLHVLTDRNHIQYLYIDANEREVDWIQSNSYLHAIFKNGAGTIYRID